ncbi:MAG: hypothetical protein ACFFHD_09865, partial [Promethearchaeota archaeon]
MIVSIFFVVFSVCVLILWVGYSISHRDNFFNQFIYLILTAAYFSIDICFILILSFSTINLFSENVALFLWKFSISLFILKSSITSTIQSFILLKNRIRILPGFIYSFLGGIIISFLYFEKIFNIQTEGLYY